MVLDQVIRIVKVPPDVGVADALARQNKYQRHHEQSEHNVKRDGREQSLAPASRRARPLLLRFARTDGFPAPWLFNHAHRLHASLVGSASRVHADTIPALVLKSKQLRYHRAVAIRPQMTGDRRDETQFSGADCQLSGRAGSGRAS